MAVALACAALCAGASAACDGTALSGTNDLDGGASPSADAGTPPEFSEPGYTAPSQLAWRVVRGRDGQSVTQAEFLAAAAQASAVCLGETHDDYAHHSLQLLVTNHVANTAVGAAFGVGMEMFELPFQAPLDEFSAGAIDEATMLQRTQWAQRWGFEWALYRPIVLFSVRRQHPVVALRAARELTSRVSQAGLAALTAAERAQLPELDLTNAQHFAWFRAQVQGAHDQLTEDRLQRMYSVQVIWDESMADTATRWLDAAAGRRMAIIAGNGHCVDLAIPMRMRRRGITSVLAVKSVLDDPTEIGDAVAEGLSDYVVGIREPTE